MPHITFNTDFPGITGPLEYRLDTGEPIRDLTQRLMRGPSDLTIGEREFVSSVVSHRNDCQFCSTAHTTVTRRYEDVQPFIDHVLKDAALHVTRPPARLEALRDMATAVTVLDREAIERSARALKDLDMSDEAVHDAVLVSALFCMYNRYVDGLATVMPSSMEYFETLADRLTTNGYVRPKGTTDGTR